jgi:hypothetical protein
MNDPVDTAKHWIDTASFVTVTGVLAGLIPAVAGLATIAWTVYRFYETYPGSRTQAFITRLRAPRDPGN